MESDMRDNKRRNLSESSRQKPIHKKRWEELTSRQKRLRRTSLEVMSSLRKSSNKKSLSKIAKEKRIAPSTVIKNTKAFKKVNNKWIVKKRDSIPRPMTINENGQSKTIQVRDSRNASKIGKYNFAIKTFLESGDKSKLVKFRNKKVKDIDGNTHIFETDATKIIKINERIESPELRDVYAA